MESIALQSPAHLPDREFASLDVAAFGEGRGRVDVSVSVFDGSPESVYISTGNSDGASLSALQARALAAALNVAADQLS